MDAAVGGQPLPAMSTRLPHDAVAMATEERGVRVALVFQNYVSLTLFVPWYMDKIGLGCC